MFISLLRFDMFHDMFGTLLRNFRHSGTLHRWIRPASLKQRTVSFQTKNQAPQNQRNQKPGVVWTSGSYCKVTHHCKPMVPPLFADSKNPSNKAQRSAALAAIAASAFVLLVVSGTWSTEIMSGQEGGGGGRGGAAELESVSAKAGALARVSGVQMVKDVKKVLQDVEATLQARVNSLSHHCFQQYGTPLLCLCRACRLWDCIRACHIHGPL